MVQNKVKVYYLSLLEDTPKKGFWDYGFLYDLLKGFDSEEVNTLPQANVAIVVIPARSHQKLITQVNSELSKVANVLLILMGDEERVFPVNKIKHKNIKIWVQNPESGKDDSYRKLGTGYPPQIHDYKPESIKKDLDWFFAGQVTHSRRTECVEQLRGLEGGYLLESKGFTEGLPHKEYFEMMSKAKVCPCPSGPETPDSFRLFEALELGCIPIADTQTPTEDWTGFWEWLFEESVPFLTISNWESLPGYIKECTSCYPTLNNRVQAWWMRYKNKMRCLLLEDIRSLGGYVETSDVTVIIPVSPIPSHPDTSILEETISSVRYHLPESQIIITFDGVREEQEDEREDYEEHIRRILWKFCDDINVKPYIFEEHLHQVGMARRIINEITTSLVLYMEQDTPLVIDEPIEWPLVEQFVSSGQSNFVRFHFEGRIPEAHKSLIIGKPEGGFLKTVQWSQRPHVASTAFYKRILSENFSDKSKCFIEDLIHGKVMEDWLRYKEQGWNQWRLHIYYPEGNIKRSYHTDGRAGGDKFEGSQVW